MCIVRERYPAAFLDMNVRTCFYRVPIDCTYLLKDPPPPPPPTIKKNQTQAENLSLVATTATRTLKLFQNASKALPESSKLEHFWGGGGGGGGGGGHAPRTPYKTVAYSC